MLEYLAEEMGVALLEAARLIALVVISAVHVMPMELLIQPTAASNALLLGVRRRGIM